MTELQSVRIDKWLWAARFFKTRTLAQEAVELGRVRLDGNRIKSSREVKPGDRLEITRGEEKFTVFVEKLSVVRGPASVAQRFIAKRTSQEFCAKKTPRFESLPPNRHFPSKRGAPPNAMPDAFVISRAKVLNNEKEPSREGLEKALCDINRSRAVRR